MSAPAVFPDDSLTTAVVYPRRAVLLLALVAGLLFGLPHLLMWGQLRAQGRPYFPLVVEHVTAPTYDETTYYAPRVREVYDGHPCTADPAGWEYKGAAAFAGVGTLPPLLLAPLVWLGHGNVGAVFALCDFLLPPLLFLLLLALGRALGVPFWVSTAGALLLLFAHNHLTLPVNLLVRPRWEILVENLQLTGAYRPLEYSRLPIPQLGYFFVIFALLGLYRTSVSPRWSTGVLTALAVGALFYTYVFFWTWVLAGAALYVLFLLLQRQPRAALAVTGAVLGGCVLALPVLLQLLAPDGYVGKAYLEARQTWGGKTVNFAHHKYELVLWVLLLVVFPWRDRRFPLMLAFLLAPYLCIMGARQAHLNIQEWHWLGRCWYPWLAFVLPVALWARVSEPCRHGLCTRVRPWVRTRLLGPVMIATAVLCLAYGANVQVRYGLSMAPYHTQTPGAAAGYAWLRDYAPPDAVVAAGDCNVLALVPVYTQCNTYLPYCLIAPASDEELIERFWITVRLLNLDDRAVERFLAPEQHSPEGFWTPHRWWMVNWIFHTRYGQLTLPPAVRRQMDRLRERLQAVPMEALLSRQRLDYLWVDEEIAAYCRSRPEQSPWLREAFRQDDVTIYTVVRASPRG